MSLSPSHNDNVNNQLPIENKNFPILSSKDLFLAADLTLRYDNDLCRHNVKKMFHFYTCDNLAPK